MSTRHDRAQDAVGAKKIPLHREAAGLVNAGCRVAASASAPLAPSFVLSTCILLGLLAPAGCRKHDAETGPLVVKIGTVLPESHPTAASLRVFQELLDRRSGGSMRVQLYFNSQLGDANEVLELCRMGDVEMAQVSTASLTIYVPLANALAMPFIWKDSAHQARMLDGHVGEVIRREARKRDLEILGYFDAGTRNITTTKGPIERPDQLTGLKIRVMNAPLMVATVDALGASAMALNMGEVYTALQMGVIDGWENNPRTVSTTRMYETGCKWFAWTRHFSIPDLFVAGEPFLRRLTPEQRRWLEEAGRETVVAQRRMWSEAEEQALADMRRGGMKINEVQNELFRRRVEPIYQQYYRRYGPQFRQLCEEILSAS